MFSFFLQTHVLSIRVSKGQPGKGRLIVAESILALFLALQMGSVQTQINKLT